MRLNVNDCSKRHKARQATNCAAGVCMHDKTAQGQAGGPRWRDADARVRALSTWSLSESDEKPGTSSKRCYIICGVHAYLVTTHVPTALYCSYKVHAGELEPRCVLAWLRPTGDNIRTNRRNLRTTVSSTTYCLSAVMCILSLCGWVVLISEKNRAL